MGGDTFFARRIDVEIAAHIQPEQALDATVKRATQAEALTGNSPSGDKLRSPAPTPNALSKQRNITPSGTVGDGDGTRYFVPQ